MVNRKGRTKTLTKFFQWLNHVNPEPPRAKARANPCDRSRRKNSSIMGVPSKKLKIAENSLPKICPRKSTTRAEPMVKKKLQPDFGSFSYSIRTDEIKIKNVPTQKLLFREKYFKEQLKNYTYLIVKQKANSKSKWLTNHLLSKKIRLRILLLLNKDRWKQN